MFRTHVRTCSLLTLSVCQTFQTYIHTKDQSYFKNIRKNPSHPITKDEKNRERLHTLLCTADLPLI